MTIDHDQEPGTDIMRHPVHLGLGATAEAEPDFTGEIAWYDEYFERRVADGREARLVSAYSFSEPWDMWEMHPEGAEVVLCIAGSMTLLQEQLAAVTNYYCRVQGPSPGSILATPRPNS